MNGRSGSRPRVPSAPGTQLRSRYSPPVDDDDLGAYLIDLLGAPACVELLAVLELPEEDRAALIGQLYATERGKR